MWIIAGVAGVGLLVAGSGWLLYKYFGKGGNNPNSPSGEQQYLSDEQNKQLQQQIEALQQQIAKQQQQPQPQPNTNPYGGGGPGPQQPLNPNNANSNNTNANNSVMFSASLLPFLRKPVYLISDGAQKQFITPGCNYDGHVYSQTLDVINNNKSNGGCGGAGYGQWILTPVGDNTSRVTITDARASINSPNPRFLCSYSYSDDGNVYLQTSLPNAQTGTAESPQTHDECQWLVSPDPAKPENFVFSTVNRSMPDSNNNNKPTVSFLVSATSDNNAHAYTLSDMQGHVSQGASFRISTTPS